MSNGCHNIEYSRDGARTTNLRIWTIPAENGRFFAALRSSAPHAEFVAKSVNKTF
jgi:hypothetical protein